MCINFRPTDEEEVSEFGVPSPEIPEGQDELWKSETWQDYAAPIIRANADGERELLIASFGMIPKKHSSKELKKYTTMNARAETIGQLRSYKKEWKDCQFCLVPMTEFYEPNWETGHHERWGISMADKEAFAVAGLWRTWEEEEGLSYSFTQITVNADEHPVMSRFHKPGEKRSLVILHKNEYDDWLNCKNPEFARTFLQTYPPEALAIRPAMKNKSESLF